MTARSQLDHAASPGFWALGVPELFFDAGLLAGLADGDPVALQALSSGLTIFLSNPVLRREAQVESNPRWMEGCAAALGRGQWRDLYGQVASDVVLIAQLDSLSTSGVYIQTLLNILSVPALSSSQLKHLRTSLKVMSKRYWDGATDLVLEWIRQIEVREPEFWVPRIVGVMHVGGFDARLAMALAPLVDRALESSIDKKTLREELLTELFWRYVLDDATMDEYLARWVPRVLPLLQVEPGETLPAMFRRSSIWVHSSVLCDEALFRYGYDRHTAIALGLSTKSAGVLLRHVLKSKDMHDLEALCGQLEERADCYMIAEGCAEDLMLSDCAAARKLGWLSMGHLAPLARH